MKPTGRLWRWLGLIFVLSFGALGYLGWQIYQEAPPIPRAVLSADGEQLFSGEQVQMGQRTWRAAGGQQLGSVWGHGSYVAPDWSADWLHREALALQAIRTAEQRQATPTLSVADQAAVDATLADVRAAAQGTQNLLVPMREALTLGATVGETCGVLREEWGEFDGA